VRRLATAAFACVLAVRSGRAEELRPLPLRDRVPEGATLFLRWSAELDGIEDLHVQGRAVEVRHVKLGRPRDVAHTVVAALPRRELGVFARLVKGRGHARVLQDPSRGNGYVAIVRVTDKGKGSAPAVVELYYGPRPPPPPPFPVEVARKPEPYEARPTLAGRFFGERPGKVRALAVGPPLFTWRGEVAEYAVLAVEKDGVALLDCGVAGTRAQRSTWKGAFAGGYVVLSRCDGRGRIRVLQGMRGGETRPLIEIDDRDEPGAGTYDLVAHAVDREAVDRLYGEPGGDAAHWLAIALDARETDRRLWAIEKVILSRSYPQRELNLLEAMTLRSLVAQEPVDAIRGCNVVLAWPPEFVRHAPTRWRFLAEVDVALDWLRHWTGQDQVAQRGKRLISRFRVDDGGIALYVDFRLHIPRKEMVVPPHHGPYSHEASHGFIGFPAICPIGRYGEGLTEVSRTAYWWFLGLEDSWRPFQERCLAALRDHYEDSGTLQDVPSYAAAAGVYLTLLRRFGTGKDGAPDWTALGRLLEIARSTPVPAGATEAQRFALLATTAEKAFGSDARAVIERLRLPE